MFFLQHEGPGSGSSTGDNKDDCDDEDDCPDGSFLCSKSTKCILESSLCDGINDCGNWEDESMCSGK